MAGGPAARALDRSSVAPVPGLTLSRLSQDGGAPQGTVGRRSHDAVPGAGVGQLTERRTTRADGIVDQLLHLMDTGVLQPGQRLASIRKAAADHAVSKNTMAGVYDRLVALARLEARPGSGYLVAPVAPASSDGTRPHIAEALDLVSLLREQLDQHYEVRPGDGRPPASWMEGSELSAQFSAMKLPRGVGVEHGYGSSWGYLPLRERLCLFLGERSIACKPNQVLLTHGANHALDLIMRDMLEPGDCVLVDDPGYYPLFGKLRLAKARMIPVRRRPDGPDLDDLAAKIVGLRPKLFFTQSLAHNPTGGSLSLPVAHGLLRLAERHDFHIVEDDPFADILPATSPLLAALDQLNRVLYIGTFSKTLSASLRVGYVAAHPRIAAALSDIKLLTVVATSDHAERFVAGLISGGHYLRHIRRLRTRVGEATTRALADLAQIGLPVSRPRDGGFYLWAELPPGIDELALCRQAASSSIFLAPGRVFRPDRQPAPPAIRIHVAHASNARFLAFMRQALERG